MARCRVTGSRPGATVVETESATRTHRARVSIAVGTDISHPIFPPIDPRATRKVLVSSQSHRCRYRIVSLVTYPWVASAPRHPAHDLPAATGYGQTRRKLDVTARHVLLCHHLLARYVTSRWLRRPGAT